MLVILFVIVIRNNNNNNWCMAPHPAALASGHGVIPLLPPQAGNGAIITTSKIDCFVFECVYKGPYNNKFTIEVH